MKSARELFEERLSPSAFDEHEKSIQRAEEKAVQGQARSRRWGVFSWWNGRRLEQMKIIGPNGHSKTSGA